MSTAAKRMEKGVGVSMQLCCTQFFIGKGSDFHHFPTLLPACHHGRIQSATPAFLDIQACNGSCKGQCDSLYPTPRWGLQDHVEFLVWFCSQHFSCNCWTPQTTSLVTLPARKPEWYSGMMESAILSTSLFNMTHARIFPVIQSREIIQWCHRMFYPPSSCIYVQWRHPWDPLALKPSHIWTGTGHSVSLGRAFPPCL